MKKIIYRERIFLDKFRCIDKEKKVIFIKSWWDGDLLYGYIDRFNTMTIAKEDIYSIEEIEEPRKFYSFNTMFRSLKDELCVFLKTNNIYYELSGCGAGWHFEVKCNSVELKKCNAFLDSVIITEQR